MDTSDHKILQLLKGPVAVENGLTGITDTLMKCLFLTPAEYNRGF